jgi:hypothetical protein
LQIRRLRDFPICPSILQIRRPFDSPHHRTVSAWIVSAMRLILFFDGRYPRYALPVFAEYISPNE